MQRAAAVSPHGYKSGPIETTGAGVNLIYKLSYLSGQPFKLPIVVNLSFTESMSNDGLLPKAFSDLHPKFRTPYKSNYILFIFVGIFAAFVPGSIAGDLTSFGTLFAFVLVCAGIWIMRMKNPDIARPFKTPLVPLVPILGIIICMGMIVALDLFTLKAAFLWMLVGLVVYFLYSKRHSILEKKE